MIKTMIFTLILLGLASTAYAQEKVPSAQGLFNLTSDLLARQYSDQPLVARGIVTYVGPNRYGLASVNLSDSVRGSTQVMCVLPYSSSLTTLGDIKKGQTITISGEYRTRSEQCGDCLVVKECSVIGQ